MVLENSISRIIREELSQNLEAHRDLQSQFPSLVLIYPLEQHQLKSGFVGQKWMLKLCCMAPGEEHTLISEETISEEKTHPELGWYVLEDLGKWAGTVIKWVKSNEKILKVVSPRLGNLLEWVNGSSASTALKEAAKDISKVDIPQSPLPAGGNKYFPFSSVNIGLTGLSENDYRNLEGQGLIFLQEVFRKHQPCANLRLFVDGDKFLWLCNTHLNEFRAKREAVDAARTEELLRNYLEQIKNETEKVRILGDSQSHELKDVFVPFSILRERGRPSARTLSEYKGMMDAELRARRIPFSEYNYPESNQSSKCTVKVEDLLKEGMRAVVVAAPGGGKSTLLRYLANQTLNNDEQLPVFLEFKTIKPEIFKAFQGTFSELIFKLAIANRVCQPNEEDEALRNTFYQLLENGKVFFFLDGLDEVSGETFFDSLRLDVKEFIQNVKYRRCSLIISTRPYALLDQYSRDEMQELELAPFNQNQIEQFVRSYYGDERLPEKFLDEMRRRHELRELASVPALLGFLLVLFRERVQAPESRLELYREIVYQLAGRWDEEKAAKRNFHTTVDRRIDFLSRLAFQSLFNEAEREFSRKLIFTSRQILRVAESYCREIEQPALADELAADVKMTPLLREVGTDTFAFAHLTIQEYLAATVLAEREDCERLFCRSYFDLMLCEMEVLPMVLGVAGECKNLYDALEHLPEAIDYKKLRLQAKSLRYGQAPDSAVENLTDKLVGMTLRERDEKVEYGYFDIIAKSFTGTAGETGKTIVRRIGEILGNEHEVYRNYAVRVLGFIGNDTAFNFLKQALEKDEDASVRIEAALEISRVDSSLAVASLKKELKTNDREIRKEITNALWQIGTEDAVEQLKNLTGDEDYFVRRTALEALSNLRGEDTISILVEKLNDPKDWVRRTAVIELGEIGGKNVTDGLIKATADDELMVAEEAVEWLGRIGGQKAYDFLVNFADKTSNRIKGTAVEALGNLGDPRAIPLLSRLLDEYSQEPPQKLERKNFLGYISGGWIADYIKVRVAFALYRLGDERGVPILSDALRNGHYERTYAAKALSQIKGKEIAPLLFEIFEKVKDDDDIHFNDAIVIGQILCDLEVEDLSPVVLAMANYLEEKKNHFSISNSEKINAINILGKAGGQSSIDALLKATEQSDPMVQLAAIVALGNVAVDNETAVEGLLIRLAAGVNVVSERAARVLARMDKTTLSKGLSLSLKSD